jgi:dienelactone hydrolase
VVAFPVVVFMPGVNVSQEAYQRFAEMLAVRGVVVLTYSFVQESFPGLVALSAGLDMRYARREGYGHGPTALLLAPLLAELAALNREGVLAGRLDLDRIFLGGHSAGGTLALQNADPARFPGVAGVFTYGAHNMASTLLGFEPGQVLPLPSALPVLMMGGTRDGVIAQSRARYGASTDDADAATDAIVRTFRESLTGGRGDQHLVLIDGANHFAIADTDDDTTARAFLDTPPTADPDAVRALLVEAVLALIAGALGRFAAGQPLIAHHEAK